MDTEKMAFSVKETAQLLGVGRNTMWKAVWRGQVPTIRIGKRRLVPKVALEQMLLGKDKDKGGTGQ